MNVLHDTLLSPPPQDPGPLAAFGRFVGSWALEWHGYEGAQPTGETGLGELHVDWILGGRALQDTWIVPGPNQPGFGTERSFFGTTVRFYDAELGAWRSTWIEPRKGLVRPFIGRMRDRSFELLSLTGGIPLRWTFSDIEPDSFTWTGETSPDEGRTWVRDEQMLATRIHTPRVGQTFA